MDTVTERAQSTRRISNSAAIIGRRWISEADVLEVERLSLNAFTGGAIVAEICLVRRLGAAHKGLGSKHNLRNGEPPNSGNSLVPRVRIRGGADEMPVKLRFRD